MNMIIYWIYYRILRTGNLRSNDYKYMFSNLKKITFFNIKKKLPLMFNKVWLRSKKKSKSYLTICKVTQLERCLNVRGNKSVGKFAFSRCGSLPVGSCVTWATSGLGTGSSHHSYPAHFVYFARPTCACFVYTDSLISQFSFACFLIAQYIGVEI